MKNLNFNQIMMFNNIKILGDEDKNKSAIVFILKWLQFCVYTQIEPGMQPITWKSRIN